MNPSVLSPKYEVFCCNQNGPPARREERAFSTCSLETLKLLEKREMVRAGCIGRLGRIADRGGSLRRDICHSTSKSSDGSSQPRF
jgi:hypothetical protein